MLAWPLAPAALAGSYTWQLPTSSAPGPSNPDLDTYGATPWTYLDAASPSMAGPPPLTPGSFRALDAYSRSIDGGLTGWQDATDGDLPFVAVNRSSGVLSGSSGLQIPSGQLALQPARDRVVAIGWTSPLSSSQTVTVSGTFQPDAQSSSCPSSQPTWVIEQDGLVLASESSPSPGAQTGPQAFSVASNVAPGDTVYVVVGWYGVPAGFNAACTTAGLSLSIQAPSTPPAVALTSPSQGQAITDAQPKFSGSSARGFGDSHTVTVRVWRGAGSQGTPLEILSPDGSTGTFTTIPQPPLPNGTYTVQAEQDDLAGDASLSQAVTFTVHNVAPRVTLSSVSTRTLLSAMPVLRGTAGSASGDSSSVVVRIWSGASAKGNPVRTLTPTRGRDGRWSIKVSPALDDGRYTAIAVQEGPGGVYGVSGPQTFRVKIRPPALELLQPAAGAIVKFGAVTFSGKAGDALGDLSLVTLELFRGRTGHGRPVASFRVRAAGGSWTRRVDRLAPGTYTALARQRDDAGHVASSSHTFTLLRPPRVIAGAVSLDRADYAQIPVMCTATSGACTGDVLMVTQRAMRPLRAGPTGHVRVLYGYVSADAGQTVLVRRSVPAYVADELRRAAPVKLVVSVKLKASTGQTITASAVTVLRLIR